MENSLKTIFQGLIETVPGMNLDLLKMDRFDKIKSHLTKVLEKCISKERIQ